MEQEKGLEQYGEVTEGILMNIATETGTSGRGEWVLYRLTLDNGQEYSQFASNEGLPPNDTSLEKVQETYATAKENGEYLKIKLAYAAKGQYKNITAITNTGRVNKKDLPKYVYLPTLNLVNFVKSKNIPVICFPRGIKNYKEYTEFVKPDAICIDYEVNPYKIKKDIKIPVQGGLNPNVLLSDKETLKKETLKYLNLFKDHPYIFNLGHGVLPETDPSMVDYLVKFVNDY